MVVIKTLFIYIRSTHSAKLHRVYALDDKTYAVEYGDGYLHLDEDEFKDLERTNVLNTDSLLTL